MTLIMKRGRLTTEKWFSPNLEWGDAFRFVLYKQVPRETVRIGFIKERFNTVLIDLSLAKDEIFSQFSQTTRNEIRRAEREGISAEEIGIEEFSSFFHRFAARAGISPFSENDRKRYGKHLFNMKAVRHDIPLAVASCLLDADRERARLFKAGTMRLETDDPSAKKLAGYANRLLQWRLIQRIKDEGFRTYDLGGCVVNSDNERLNNIGKFKLGFSKNVVAENNFCSLPFYLKGKILRVMTALGLSLQPCPKRR